MTSIQKPVSQAHRGNTRFRSAMAAVLASVVLSGCGVVNNMIYKTTGDVMQGFPAITPCPIYWKVTTSPWGAP